MDYFIRRLVAVSLGCMLSACGTTNVRPSPPNITVAQVVSAIQAALDTFYVDSSDNKKSNIPNLQSVDIGLKTVGISKTQGELDYLFVAVKGFYNTSQTQEIDLTLSPQEPKTGLLGPSLGIDITKSLRKAITLARKQVKTVYDGKIPLYTHTVKVQIAFAITAGGSAGPEFSIGPVSLSAADEVSKNATDTITLTFSNSPVNSKKPAKRESAPKQSG